MSEGAETTFPESFTARISAQLGGDTANFFNSLKSVSPVSIRLNSAKAIPTRLTGRPIPWCKNGIYLNERPVFTLDPFFHAGCYYVQEPGSMVIELLMHEVFRRQPGPLHVLDLCAAPGGKTTHILSMLPPGSCLVSNEPVSGRNTVLRENTTRWGYADLIHTQNEPAAFAASGVKFDLIVVDAPCSGEGLFRKDPDSITEWSERQAEGCAVRQQQILDTIHTSLKPGGFLIYSTCTYNVAENEAQALRLIQNYGYESCMPTTPSGFEQCRHGWQAWPHKVDAEGFYCVLLQKSDGADTENEKIKLNTRKPIELKVIADCEVKEWLKHPEGFDFFSHSNFVYAMSDHCFKLLSCLTGSLYIRQAGLPVAEKKGNNMIPLHNLAMSIDRTESLPQAVVDLEGALRYLRGHDPGVETNKVGWHLLRYETAVLGWIKCIGSRINNYYPAPLRIKMR